MNFSCIRVNNDKSIDTIVINHVDVSSCGISLRRDLLHSQSLT